MTGGQTQVAADTLTQRIMDLAPYYTPEWHFTGTCEDIGGALALLYCRMLTETLERLELSEENIKTDFLNLLGATRLPPSPATGIITLNLADGAETGSLVPKGSRLLSENGFSYETLDDVFAGPAKLTDIWMVSPETDFLRNVSPPFRLFDGLGQNLQRHTLYLRYDEALNVSAGAELRIGGLPESPTLDWSYSSDEGFAPLGRERRDGGDLILTFPDGAPPLTETEAAGMTGRMLRAQAVVLTGGVQTAGLTVSSAAHHIRPDSVFSEGSAQDAETFYPFGARFTVYNELYVFSDEAFSKRGGKVTLSVRLTVRETPLENELPMPEVNWKAFMKKSEYNPVTVYDITVEEVIWEYWNGRGWIRLLQGRERFFSTSGEVSLNFIVPPDITPVEYGPAYGYAVRARLLSVKNAYRPYARFLSPHFEGLRLSYQSAARPPERAYVLNNGSGRDHTGAGYLLETVPSPSDALYLGFDRSFDGGPTQLFIDVEPNPDALRRRLIWEILDAHGDWIEAEVRDKTNDLTNPGTITFPLGPTLTEVELFGCRRHWIRVRALEPKPDSAVPHVLGIYPNAAAVTQTERRAEFWASLSPDSRTLPLPYGGVTDIEVTVDGEVWSERPDLQNSKPDDHHYAIDRGSGIIAFCDGRLRIPGSRGDNIRVTYATCAGSAGSSLAGSSFKPSVSLGFVNAAVNPSEIGGGTDLEPTEAAVHRCTAFVRHRGRAITPEDYESLALEACRELAKVRAFPNLDAQATPRNGCVTLVVLQETRDGVPFEPVRRRVLDTLREHCPLCGELAVVPARLLRFDVQAQLEWSGEKPEPRRIKEALDRFLHPVNGYFNSEGWDFGRLPSGGQIKNVLARACRGGRILRFSFSCCEAGGTEPIDPYAHPFILPLPGEHEIT